MSSRCCQRRTLPQAISLGTLNRLKASAVTPRWLSWCVAIPKSPSFSCSFSHTKTLNGVRSRCSACPMQHIEHGQDPGNLAAHEALTLRPFPLEPGAEVAVLGVFHDQAVAGASPVGDDESIEGAQRA